MIRVQRVHAVTVVAVLMVAAGCKARREAAPSAADSTTTAEEAAGGVVQTGNDYGPSADVQTLRAMWQKESSANDTIVQTVVVANAGVVEIRDGGPNSPFLNLYQQDSSGTWQDHGIITGPLAVCGLTSKSIPDSVAREIVAHDTRLSATNRADPRAGCSG